MGRLLMPPKNSTPSIVVPSNPCPVVDENAAPSANWRWKMAVVISDGRDGSTVPA